MAFRIDPDPPLPAEAGGKPRGLDAAQPGAGSDGTVTPEVAASVKSDLSASE
jgi:hypothetical protein